MNLRCSNYLYVILEIREITQSKKIKIILMQVIVILVVIILIVILIGRGFSKVSPPQYSVTSRG